MDVYPDSSRLLAVCVFALALLQGVAPLMHVHTGNADESGLHMHLSDIGGGQDRTIAMVSAPESTVIASPTQYRRDEQVTAFTLLAAVARFAFLLIVVVTPARFLLSAASAVRHRSGTQLPPSQAPPRRH